MCVCMYVCMHGCMYVCMYVCMHACMHVCMYVCMHACMHVCMYVCMYCIVCMYVCNLLKSDLFQRLYVVAFQWDPRQPRLAICTANNKLYMWSPAGCVSVVVPTEGKNILRLFVFFGLVFGVFQSNLDDVSINKNLL